MDAGNKLEEEEAAPAKCAVVWVLPACEGPAGLLPKPCLLAFLHPPVIPLCRSCRLAAAAVHRPPRHPGKPTAVQQVGAARRSRAGGLPGLVSMPPCPQRHRLPGSECFDPAATCRYRCTQPSPAWVPRTAAAWKRRRSRRSTSRPQPRRRPQPAPPSRQRQQQAVQAPSCPASLPAARPRGRAAATPWRPPTLWQPQRLRRLQHPRSRLTRSRSWTSASCWPRCLHLRRQHLSRR